MFLSVLSFLVFLARVKSRNLSALAKVRASKYCQRSELRVYDSWRCRPRRFSDILINLDLEILISCFMRVLLRLLKREMFQPHLSGWLHLAKFGVRFSSLHCFRNMSVDRFLALQILIFSKYKAFFRMSLPWWELMVLKRESIQAGRMLC